MTGPGLNAAGLPPEYPFRPDLEITPRQAKGALDDPDSELLLIDCRTVGEWNTVRIKGATHIPLDELPARLADLDDDPTRPIAVHCHHGGRSIKATLFLRRHGFTNVKSVAGGIDLWAIEIDPSLPRY